MAASTSKCLCDGNVKMQPLLFEALEADGSNYMDWSHDLKAYLCAEVDNALTSSTLIELLTASK